ncbi:MAG: hypothetical protein QG626_752 [Patescibacteria group bacterium]|jgi:type II secretory pathway pseudopilin PulG|nr:hypothetical protein [Patescibacteria group bacterium]
MKNIRGFTLIELVLYMAVLAVLMLTISVLLSTLLRAKMKMRVMREVDEQGELVMSELAAWMRTADGILTPGTGGEGAEIEILQTYPVSAARNVTVVNGQLGIVTNGGDWTPITNSQVEIDSFTVREVSSGATIPAVQIALVIRGVSTSGRNEYVYSREFITTVSIR